MAMLDPAPEPSQVFLEEISPLDEIRRDTLARIEHFQSAPEQRVYRDLKGMCDRVSDSYRDRVITELLQNAHDAHPIASDDGRIHFALDAYEGTFGTLYVANDGQGFTRDNFKALCSPTLTTKHVNEAIGNKGVGFLSVFQVSAHPEVFSRMSETSGAFDGYCFSFSTDETLKSFLQNEGLGDDASQIIASMPRLYLACPEVNHPATVQRFAEQGFATLIRLPLRAPDALAAVQTQLEALADEDPPMQLFLTRIKELSISLDPSEPARVLCRNANIVHAEDDLCLRLVECGHRTYLVAQKTIDYHAVVDVITRDIAAEKLPETWVDWTGDAIVSLAVAVDGQPLDARLYNFLPMGAGVRAPFAGYLDAPFLSTLDRLQVQSGVEFNAFLWAAARELAIEAAAAARDHLPRDIARQATLDLLLWSAEREMMRAMLLERDAQLIPSLSSGGKPTAWSSLSKTRVWQGDDFLTAAVAARHASFAIVDDAIGTARMQALVSFVSGTSLLSCSPAVRADIVESVAKGLVGKSLDRWNSFYNSLADLFRNDASSLAGRSLLLDSRGELKAAETSGVERGRRRRRLRAMFLPPLRGAGIDDTHVVLPRAVQQRISFMHAGLDLTRNQASAARRFLLTANLVREHESREILRLLAGALNEPGDAHDPEALRWEALLAMMRISIAEDVAKGILTDINPLVPTREGWSRATTAYFVSWPGTGGSELAQLFESAAGLSAEFDQHGARLLRSYADWNVPPNERDSWTEFLRRAGVSEVLRPVPAIVGAMPRGFPSVLQPALAQRSNLPQDQRSAWTDLLPNPWGVTNPQTDYTAKAVHRLPGQLDFDALGPATAPAFAIALIRMLQAQPSIVGMTVYRPNHPHAPNERRWPSPVGAFLRAAKWVLLADGRLASLAHAWLPGEGRTPPPLLPLVAPEVRRVLAQCPDAAEILADAGLPEFGQAESAWRLLFAVGQLVREETESGDAERLFSAAQEAWSTARLDQLPPAGLRLLGRRCGRIVSVDPRADSVKILVADGDDRQLLAATARADASAVLIEPLPAHIKAVANYLAQHFPATVLRASQIEARFESAGEPLVFSALDPTLDQAFGDGPRQVLALTLRYRASFYRGNSEETLERLATVRVRRLASLDLRVGDLVEPVPRFDHRAVVLSDSATQTILYSDALAASEQLLIGLAPAIAMAVRAPNTVGDPMLALAAELGPSGLHASFDDYAAILHVPVEEVKNVLGAARASIANVLRTLRPFIAYAAGLEAAGAFVARAELVHEDDLIAALAPSANLMPEPPRDFVQRCRDAGNVEAIAIALRLNLARLNEVLAELGPPYVTIDLTSRHETTLATFMGRKEGSIRESIRASFCTTFDAGKSLADYVAARDAPRLSLPAEFGTQHIELTTATMQQWLDQWMAGHGVQPNPEPASPRQHRDAVRDANLKLLRASAADFRTAILARAAADDPLRSRVAGLSETETAMVEAALGDGWIDFDRLDRDRMAFWLVQSGLWPKDWQGIALLGITPEERAAREAQDEASRVAASTVKRQMHYAGGVFTFGEDAMGGLADHIAALVAGNASLLETSARTAKGTAPDIRPSSGGGGKGGGGAVTRLTDDERALIGFFGEAIAFEWLKRKFGANRVVDEGCWKSEYRNKVYGSGGDDTLGYDFDFANGATRWYFEVKSTMAPGASVVQSLELTANEFHKAEACRADRRERYRILYVTDALNPDNAGIVMLPNPRSREGLTFYTDLHARHRLYFPLTR